MMTTLRTLCVALVSAGFVAACSSDGPSAPVVGPYADGAPPGGGVVLDGSIKRQDAADASTAEVDTDGDAGPALGTDARISTAVKVTIASPAANAVHRLSDELKPDVTVHVMGNSIVEKPEKVTALVYDGKGNLVAMGELDAVRSENVPETDDVSYRYKDKPVDLSRTIASGTYTLRVLATMRDASIAYADVRFEIDAGPTIVIESPTEGQPLRKTADVRLSAKAATFGPVQTVTLTIGKHAIPLAGPDGMGVYSATVDFDKFEPPLDGEQLITVVATNKEGTQTVATRKFVVDNDGPAITEAKPAEGELIGGVVTIRANVADQWSGVADKSVVAVIAHGDTMLTVKLDPPAPGAMTPTYSARFDTRLLPNNAIYPHVSFRASDKLGNESSIGYLVSLDNTPPLADLDPPQDFRGWKKSGADLQCGWQFDPVGPDAVDDGVAVNQVFDVRARIEDQGNSLLGGSADFTPIATVDARTVFLYVLDDTSKPLVVDTDGDGVCDAVNPSLVPTTTPMSSNDALLVNLVPITPTGSPDMTVDPNASCPPGTQSLPPDPACDTTVDTSKTRWGVFPQPSGPPIITAHSYYASMFMSYAVNNLAAIWTLPPIVANRLQCAGRQLDALGSNVADGWVCMAVGAADALGNAQVSRVLRVCVDKDASGDCPHIKVASVTAGAPMVVTTVDDHGLATGDEAIVSEVLRQTGANRRWTVTVTGPKTFSLDGSVGIAELGDSTGSGRVVATKVIPDCTGTQTAKGPPPVITDKACEPWRLYEPGESRVFY